MAEKNSYTISLSDSQQDKLVNLIKQGNYQLADVPYTRIAAKGSNISVNLYTSGKCVIQGKAAGDWIRFTLEPEVLGEARLGYEHILNPGSIAPHMGIDESGKGDFFGPLVIAAAYVDESIAEQFKSINVRDSKTISSDKVAEDMADKIAGILGRRFSVVPIGPAAYNRMYSKMKNLNMLLAWGHARAIENLLEVVPSCPRALSDQFGPRERIERALMEKGRQIKLEQRPKAESDPAVAAASILARAGFLKALREMGRENGVVIPKGVSATTKQVAIELTRKNGAGFLTGHCKGHFRTADEVLSAAGFSRADVPDLPRSNPVPFMRRSTRPTSPGS